MAPAPRAIPAPSEFMAHWQLAPGAVFLNHGSFGATPRLVLEAQRAWRDRLEADPVRFFVEDHQDVMDATRRAVAAFVGCAWEELALVPNASIAVATVFANLRLAPGDEVLITGHEYPACQNTARRVAGAAGARVVTADLPFPIAGKRVVIDAVLAALTPRTRVAMLSHVTSPSGLVLPVEELVPLLEARGVRTLVDGAHAAGMLPTLNFRTLGCSYYTTNCHKWICSPKGSALLFVRSDLQEGFRPLALSNNAEKPKPGRAQFLTEFDYVGTQDMTACYAIADALRVMAGMLPQGWPAIMAHNRDLVLRGREIVCGRLGVEPPAPADMIGSIASMVLPAHSPERHARLMARPSKYHDALQDRLLDKWKIQVPVWGVPGKTLRICRISAQLYNSEAQYAYLAEALAEELAAEGKE